MTRIARRIAKGAAVLVVFVLAIALLTLCSEATKTEPFRTLLGWLTVAGFLGFVAYIIGTGIEQDGVR